MKEDKILFMPTHFTSRFTIKLKSIGTFRFSIGESAIFFINASGSFV